jgi:choloylglycine hydrolase
LFYFPNYGSYEAYQSVLNDRTIADLQLVQWILSQFATIDEVVEALPTIHVVSLDPSMLTLHWRIADSTGRQVVLEIVNGQYHVHENKIGVLTNSPSFPWHITNLNNYVNLNPGVAKSQKWGGVELSSISAGSSFHGIPGDVTSPSRFVRAAFFVATAPQSKTAFDAVLQAFHILNNFDVPIAIENPNEKELPSATQWTSAIDLTARCVYYKTAYNSTIRCIDLREIDFTKAIYASYPLDQSEEQPIETIKI